MIRRYIGKGQDWTLRNTHFAIVNNWNSLPDTVVNARSVLDFERKLDRVWKCQRQKWDYTATIENICLDHNDHLTIEPSFSDSKLESQV